jgi:hypothetical protein
MPFLGIFASYGQVLFAVFNMHSKERRKKAFTTCSTHLTVVTFYYAPFVYTYLRPGNLCSPVGNKILPVNFKATLRFHITPVRITMINNTTNNRCWQGCGQKATLLHCWWECKLVKPLWKKIWRLPKNLKIDLPYDPAIPLLGIYPKECDIGYSRAIYTPMFIAALFTTAKIWKQQRFPTTDK